MNALSYSVFQGKHDLHELLKGRKGASFVIPERAGIQSIQTVFVNIPFEGIDPLQTPTNHDFKGLGNKTTNQGILHPDQLLLDYVSLFSHHKPGAPILDLASGEGHNGIFLATRGLVVILCDRSQRALRHAANLARKNHVRVKLWQVDLEEVGANPLPRESFAGILVFHYLHRPLIPEIKSSIEKGGILFYKTFTMAQSQFGRPKNPDFLLNPGELYAWFQDWEVIHHFEGTLENPTRAISQIVCRKPNP